MENQLFHETTRYTALDWTCYRGGTTEFYYFRVCTVRADAAISEMLDRLTFYNPIGAYTVECKETIAPNLAKICVTYCRCDGLFS